MSSIVDLTLLSYTPKGLLSTYLLSTWQSYVDPKKTSTQIGISLRADEVSAWALTDAFITALTFHRI